MLKIIVSTSSQFTNREIFNESIDSILNTINEPVTLLLPDYCTKTKAMAIQYAKNKNIGIKIIGTHESLKQQAKAIQTDAIAREGHICLLFQTGKKINIRSIEKACLKYEKTIRYIRA
jgi:hypothetical protein